MSADASLVLPVAVEGTRNALEAAAKNSTIKRFVLTSSSAAAIIPRPGVDGLYIDESELTFNRFKFW
jgi:nucleoside-diphosphate-sugar epimerase